MGAKELRKSGVFVGRTVLLVDDEKIERDLLKSILLKIGFETVDEAEDGSAALRKLDENRYDLILCDIMMKPMNGIEFARTLRNSANVRFDVQKSRTKLVFLTASSDRNTITAARPLNIQGYLLKPVDPHMMREKLMGVFGA